MTDRLSGGALGAGGGSPSVFGTGLVKAGPSGTEVTAAAPPGVSLLTLGTAMDPIIFKAGTYVSWTSWFMGVGSAGMETWVNVSINGVPTPTAEIEALGSSSGSASRVVMVTQTFPVDTPLWFDLRCGKTAGPAGTITYSAAELLFWRLS